MIVPQDLARARGDLVYFQDSIPTEPPGLHDLENARKQMKGKLAAVPLSAYYSGDRHYAVVGKGQISTFQKLSPEFLGGEPMVQFGLRFIRRVRAPSGYDYFIVNKS